MYGIQCLLRLRRKEQGWAFGLALLMCASYTGVPRSDNYHQLLTPTDTDKISTVDGSSNWVLLPMWDTWIEFLTPSFSLSTAMAVAGIWEVTNIWEITMSVYFFSLCLTNK